MKQPINRKDFLKSILLGISAFFLDACRKPDPPAPKASPTPIPANTPQPTATATPSPSPTPALPSYCRSIPDAETYLFGIGATRVQELEPGVYQLVIDKNIDVSSLSANIGFVLHGNLNAELIYKILRLNEIEKIVDVYDAEYISSESRLIGEISNLREGEFGTLVPVSILADWQRITCHKHPDFVGNIFQDDSLSLLQVSSGIRFERILVKSRTQPSNTNQNNSQNNNPGVEFDPGSEYLG